jgi:hypothetical protein
MVAGARLVAALVMGMLAVPAVTACGLLGDSSSPCYVATEFNAAQVKISGPKVHGCDAGVHTEVASWEYLGLGFGWHYGVPPPAGAPACTVTSGDQTWVVWGGGSGAGSYCQTMRTMPGAHLWQMGEKQAGN